MSITVSFMLVPMTLGYVSSELYGIWLTLSSVIIWLLFFDVGFTLGLKNKLAEAIALEQWERGKSLVSTTYFMMVIIFIPLCIILEMLVPLIDWPSFLNVSNEHASDIQKTMYILVACFCMQMIVNVLNAVVSAFQKVALSAAFPVIGNILSLLIIFILTKVCPPSLYVLSLAISVMPILVVLIASIILYTTKFKRVSPSIHSISSEYVKDLFNLGVKFFICLTQAIIMTQSTNILISNLSGPNDVTTYNIAYKYIGAVFMLFNIILTPLWPAFTDAYAQKDFIWMRNLYTKMQIVCLFLIAGIVLMIVVSPLVYHIWIGDKVNVPFIMTILVGAYIIIYIYNSLQVNLINGIGAIKLQTYVSVLGMVCHIPLSLLLGKFIGGYGVIVSMCIITLIYIPFFSTQIHRILNEKAKGIWIE